MPAAFAPAHSSHAQSARPVRPSVIGRGHTVLHAHKLANSPPQPQCKHRVPIADDLVGQPVEAHHVLINKRAYPIVSASGPSVHEHQHGVHPVRSGRQPHDKLAADNYPKAAEAQARAEAPRRGGPAPACSADTHHTRGSRHAQNAPTLANGSCNVTQGQMPGSAGYTVVQAYNYRPGPLRALKRHDPTLLGPRAFQHGDRAPPSPGP
jgi:hypothetical protein